MEFFIEKSDAKRCLDLVSKAISSRTMIPIFSKILISAEDDTVTFRATSENLDITAYCEAEVTKPGICCADNLLVGLMSGFTDSEPIRFRLGKRLSIAQGKKRKYQITIVDHEDYPQKIAIDNYSVVSGSEIARAFSVCAVAIGEDEARPILLTYNVNPLAGTIGSADGYQLAIQREVPVTGEMANPIGTVINSVLSIIGSCKELEVSFGRWSAFKTDDWRILVNSIEGKFPDVMALIEENIIKDTPVLSVEFNKSELARVMRVVSVCSARADNEKKAHHLSLRRENGEVRATMDAEDLIEFDELLDCQANGLDEFEIWLNPKFLSSVLNCISGDKLVIDFYGAKKLFSVRDPENEEFTYLCTPMAEK